MSNEEETEMIIIPAIDLKEGKCVRLLQGDFDRETVYSRTPADVARRWQDKGAERIHVVDLDGSKEGKPLNRKSIEKIVNAVSVPVQVGGGIRDIETVDAYLALGVSRCILGTVALKNRPLLVEACRRFPGHIILGLDARDERVAVEGWLERSDLSAAEVAKSYEGIGLDALVYTDISRDGMKTGVNVAATETLARTLSIPVIASGGLSGIGDIEALLEVRQPGIMGVIVGKALYDGAMTLEEAIATTKRGDRRGTSH